jgi:hypothetical protein
MGASKLLREIKLSNHNLSYYHIFNGFHNYECLGTIILHVQKLSNGEALALQG